MSPARCCPTSGRDGSRTELGRITDEQSAFAVSADGFSVVHAIAGPVQGENPIAAGESELVVQDLSGDVINRIVVPGPVRPLAVDADRVWFDRMADFIEEPYVWERETGAGDPGAGRSEVVRAGRPRQPAAAPAGPQGDGCIRSLDVTDVEAPTEQWRRCGVGYQATFDPTATRIATMSFDAGAVIHLLDPRDGSVLDTVDLDADFAGQFVWTAGGTSLVVEAITEGGLHHLRRGGDLRT